MIKRSIHVDEVDLEVVEIVIETNRSLEYLTQGTLCGREPSVMAEPVTAKDDGLGEGRSESPKKKRRRKKPKRKGQWEEKPKKLKERGKECPRVESPRKEKWKRREEISWGGKKRKKRKSNYYWI